MPEGCLSVHKTPAAAVQPDCEEDCLEGSLVPSEACSSEALLPNGAAGGDELEDGADRGRRRRLRSCAKCCSAALKKKRMCHPMERSYLLVFLVHDANLCHVLIKQALVTPVFLNLELGHCTRDLPSARCLSTSVRS